MEIRYKLVDNDEVKSLYVLDEQGEKIIECLRSGRGAFPSGSTLGPGDTFEGQNTWVNASMVTQWAIDEERENALVPQWLADPTAARVAPGGNS